jgi:hypothetical protein
VRSKAPSFRKPFGLIVKSMSQIEAYTGRDEGTLETLVKTQGFPARLAQGRWQAVTKDIVNWYRQNAANRSVDGRGRGRKKDTKR